MFKKVLIAEDIDSVNQGVELMLHELGVSTVELVQYCDDASLRIKKGVFDNAPYDLLITDLFFVSDHRAQELKSGEDLAKFAKKNYPDLKIIVYSVDNRFHKVRDLIQNAGVDAYVCKGRNGLKELAHAINAILKDETYLSSDISNALNSNSNLEINEYDIELLRLLSLGISQSEISQLFLDKNRTPNSLSSIEKRINKLKDQFLANNATHLVTIVKDLGLI